MSTTISKGKMFACTVIVNDKTLETMKHAPEIVKAIFQNAAAHWHDNILPDHFKAQAHYAYGYAPRAPKYLNYPKKRGKPDLVYSGSMRNDLITRVSYIEQAGGGIAVRMWAKVFNLYPAMAENSQDFYLKANRKTGRSLPNLKREVKIVLGDEKEALAQIIVNRLERAFGEDDTESENFT